MNASEACRHFEVFGQRQVMDAGVYRFATIGNADEAIDFTTARDLLTDTIMRSLGVPATAMTPETEMIHYFHGLQRLAIDKRIRPVVGDVVHIAGQNFVVETCDDGHLSALGFPVVACRLKPETESPR